VAALVCLAGRRRFEPLRRYGSQTLRRAGKTYVIAAAVPPGYVMSLPPPMRLPHHEALIDL
jgi:hypothetical protein